MGSLNRTNVLILGGGFAGVYTAAALEGLLGDDVGVTLINRDNFFLVTPLLFEAASGVLEPRHAVMPIRRMFRSVGFMQGMVRSIDLPRAVVGVELVDGNVREVGFDHLVLALGGVTNTKLIPGSEHGRTFKSLADAIALRNHCIRVFEEAEIESDAKRRAGLLTFVIVGGGLVGVELQGELTEFVTSIRSAYPSVKDEEIRFELIEAGPRLVPEMDEELGAYVEKTFKRRGVRVRLNTKVSKMEETKLFIGEEVIEAKTIVVATGVVPHPLIGSLALEKDGKGRLKVESSMRCAANPKIWALGDCAAIPDPEGKPYPMLAQHALREAKCLAGNLAAAIGGGEIRPFVYKSKGTLASLGHYKGVGKVYKIKIYGLLAWWVWRTYYLMQMPRWSRRVRMVIDWTVALFFKNDVVELDMSEQKRQ
jgi:NADH:ubiquinone reductase (H+-translocating)